MSIEYEAGYALPSGDEPLTNARILHAGNKAVVERVLAGSAEVSGYGSEALRNSLTSDYWKISANSVGAPYSLSAWTLSGVTLASDNVTLSQTGATSEHYAELAATFDAEEWGVTIEITRNQAKEIKLVANDGVSSFSAFFDLTGGGVVGTLASANASIYEKERDAFVLSMSFSPVAGTGYIRIYFSDGSEAVSFAGNALEGVKVDKTTIAPDDRTVDFYLKESTECDTVCIAGHNLGSHGCVLNISHDSNNDGTYTTIHSWAVPDDEPFMLVFDPITSSRWRINPTQAAGAEIAVVSWGKSLKMPQAIYGGHAPTVGARNVQFRSNVTERGEWLSRSRIRLSTVSNYSWQHLTTAWVSANLYGKNGLIRALEREPAFVAWRPDEAGDVDYVSTSKSVGAPSKMGVRDLMSFGFGGECYTNE